MSNGKGRWQYYITRPIHVIILGVLGCGQSLFPASINAAIRFLVIETDVLPLAQSAGHAPTKLAANSFFEMSISSLL